MRELAVRWPMPDGQAIMDGALDQALGSNVRLDGGQPSRLAAYMVEDGGRTLFLRLDVPEFPGEMWCPRCVYDGVSSKWDGDAQVGWLCRRCGHVWPSADAAHMLEAGWRP